MITRKKISVFPLVLANSLSTLPYLSLGMVAAYLRRHDDGALLDYYEVGRLQLGGPKAHPIESIYAQLEAASQPVCLLSSYVWNHPLNMKAAKAIKEYCPSALIIIGGPEIPKYTGETEAFMNANPAIDVAVLGEGEVACAEILSKLSSVDLTTLDLLEGVTGIVYRSGGKLLRTGERERIKDVNQIPSPYLSGEFEPWFEGFAITILETNRGCPYGCTYCDWGSATLQKIAKFDPNRVKAEIRYIAESKAEAIFIADANFGMLEQDIDIARTLVEIRAETGYPRRLYTNFAKNGGRRLMSVIEILHDGGLLPTGIIALQTTDKDVLKTIKRDNIKTSSYETMMAYFNSRNIPMASDLMIGLPGQTIDSLERDLQFCFDWKVSAHGNYTSMMPNAPMAEAQYKEENLIVTDSNNMVASTSTFTADDLEYMKSLYSTYLFHVKLAVLKYYLYFLQIDYGIPAMTFLRRWLDRVLEKDQLLTISMRLYYEVFDMDSRKGDWAQLSWSDNASFLFDNLESYFEEIYQFTQREFGIRVSDGEREAIFSAQGAVIPSVNRTYPFKITLRHDVKGYFETIKSKASIGQPEDSVAPLASWRGDELIVGVEADIVSSIAFNKVLGHADEGWELSSPLRFY